jgi:hypothetical protein
LILRNRAPEEEALSKASNVLDTDAAGLTAHANRSSYLVRRDGDLRAVSKTNEEPYRRIGRPPWPDAGVDDLHASSYGSEHLFEPAGRLFRRH